MVPDKFEEKDSEYQFNNDEESNMIYEGQESDAETAPVSDVVSGEGESSDSAQPVKPTKVTKRNRMMLIIMGVLAILIVYKLVSLLFFEKPAHSPFSQPAISHTVAPSSQNNLTDVLKGGTSQQKTTVSTAPIVTPSQISGSGITSSAATAGATETDIHQQVADLKKQNEQLLNELSAQKDETKAMQTAMHQKLQDLQSTVSGLQDVIQDLNKQLKQQKTVQQVSIARSMQQKKIQDKQVQNQMRYFVEAVIPGRAWLKAADGSALTVTVGDEVPGYGKVTSINSYSGTVLTNSGNKIYYGVNG